MECMLLDPRVVSDLAKIKDASTAGEICAVMCTDMKQ